MDLSSYHIEHLIEKEHWWFVGRRRLFEKIISDLSLKPDASILDVGSSSGTNLRLLKSMGFVNFFGLDIAIESKEFCNEKKLGDVLIGDIQSYRKNIKYYDLIIATDVIEHLKCDEKALKNIYAMLKPGGYMLLTVPCFKELWGMQDVLSHHLRRYRKSEVLRIIESAKFCIVESFYFNFLMFFPILFVRKILCFLRRKKNENLLNNYILNSILKKIFLFDCWISRKLNPPFGVSALVLAKKRKD